MYTSQKKQLGFSLIEVMVAALVLSTAILGVAGLQMLGMKGTQQSFMKSQAMNVGYNMIEQMRANHDGVIDGEYEVASASFSCSTALPTCTAYCSSDNVALIDKINIICGYESTGTPPSRTGGVKVTNNNDKAVLVNGTLNVVCTGIGGSCANGDVRVIVGWDERALGNEVTSPKSITINTRIGTP